MRREVGYICLSVVGWLVPPDVEWPRIDFSNIYYSVIFNLNYRPELTMFDDLQMGSFPQIFDLFQRRSHVTLNVANSLDISATPTLK